MLIAVIKNVVSDGVHVIAVDSQMSTTVCQVYLLMGRKGKFHQFAGLVDKCESGDPRTTCQDLQGFWDMIFIQVTFIFLCFLY